MMDAVSLIATSERKADLIGSTGAHLVHYHLNGSKEWFPLDGTLKRLNLRKFGKHTTHLRHTVLCVDGGQAVVKVIMHPLEVHEIDIGKKLKFLHLGQLAHEPALPAVICTNEEIHPRQRLELRPVAILPNH